MINGQKIFTSLASYADYVWLAVRTDPDAPKHKGITIILVPTTDPGLLVHEDLDDGERQHVPARSTTTCGCPTSAIVGEVNRGWDLIINQLNYERVTLCPPGHRRAALDETSPLGAGRRSCADGRRVIDQEWVQLNLARVARRLEFLTLINWKVASARRRSNPADAQRHQGVRHRVLHRGLPAADGGARASAAACRDGARRGAARRRGSSARTQGSLILTFGGGANEIQRDLIALFGLGMPRTPRT